MSYIGKVDMNDANIKHYSLTGSTLTTVNIGWVPASEQSLRVTINGVVQQGDTFSLSGSNLTLGGALVATDDLEVVGIQSVGNLITPADNSVTTTKLADDAVTLAKMAGGTDGNLITYDASGNPAYVATGSATNILTSNGAGAAPTFQAASTSGFISYTVYTAASSTWTKTDNNPTKLVVEVQGAGGSGGGGGASKGAGGGGGGYARKFLDVTNIDTCTIEVGVGGLNPTTNSAGNVGGASKFYKASGSGSFTSIDGLGGAGGAATYGAGGLGGVSSGGDLNISGGSGGGNSNENNHGGGSFFTPSHYSVTSGLNPSGPGTGYGGGGEGSRVTGGGAGSKGGDGMNGIVVVWEYK